MGCLELLLPLTYANPYQVMMGKTLGVHTAMYKRFAGHLGILSDIGRSRVEVFSARKAADELNEYEKSSYLSRAIDRRKVKGEVSEQELRELCTIALTAAVDTTSAVISWCLLHLALNPEVQEALANEISREGIHAGKLGERTAYPYLHAFIREQHRITPAAPISISKKLSGALDVHSVTFEKDSRFALNSYGAGMDPKLISDPNVFRPERWLDDAVVARKGTPAEILDHTLYSGPFSAGIRRCPGSRVANLEVHALILHIVAEWHIKPAGRGLTLDQIPYRQGTAVQPEMPCLDFMPRSGR